MFGQALERLAARGRCERLIAGIGSSHLKPSRALRPTPGTGSTARTPLAYILRQVVEREYR